MTDLLVSRSALFHEDSSGKRTHRLRLSRGLGDGLRVAVCMVNPSIADDQDDDPTIKKIIGFGHRLGWGHIDVVNKFAHIATDVSDLRALSAVDAIGPNNDEVIAEAFNVATHVVFAWGPMAKLPQAMRNRWRTVDEIARQVGKIPLCWGTVQDGHPYHPLMLAYSTPLEPWSAPT